MAAAPRVLGVTPPPFQSPFSGLSERIRHSNTHDLPLRRDSGPFLREGDFVGPDQTEFLLHDSGKRPISGKLLLQGEMSLERKTNDWVCDSFPATFGNHLWRMETIRAWHFYSGLRWEMFGEDRGFTLLGPGWIGKKSRIVTCIGIGAIVVLFAFPVLYWHCWAKEASKRRVLRDLARLVESGGDRSRHEDLKRRVIKLRMGWDQYYLGAPFEAARFFLL